MSWYLFGQLRLGRSFLDPLPSSNSYIFDFPLGSLQLSLEDIKTFSFLQSSKHLFKYQFSFLYNFLKSIRSEISIPSYIMAAVAPPILPFDDLERYAVSDELESSISLKVPVFDSKTHSSSDRYLVVSPYDEKPHLLDLGTLDTPNQLLARALVGLKCLREDYATAPYIETFNWQEIIDSLRELAKTFNHKWEEESFYIVVFRSQVPPETVAHYSDLGVLDKAAHAEATESGGFLKYWFGVPDKNGRNLATCVWRSSRDAKIGSVGPHHRAAANAARHMYTEWKIERLRLLVKDDIKEWEIEQWVD
ncbi:hypothetical protein EAF04_005180 [Stromatinia cepivora]|nr:hypothetical protein EAF04_005180 [Stromatinia cepivora]